MTNFLTASLVILEDEFYAIPQGVRSEVSELLNVARAAQEKARFIAGRAIDRAHQEEVLKNDQGAWDWNYSTAQLRPC